MVFDLVIKNGTLVDPERGKITVGNIAVTDDKIVAITREEVKGQEEINANLHIVSPGFVDIHAHLDGYLYSAQCMVRQGVTTSIGGNCGFGPLDLDAFFNDLEARGYPLHQGMMVGHSFTLREKVGLINPYIAATPEQIQQMAYLLEKAFDYGALGLSFGLEYAPGTSFEEIIALSKIAAKYGKLVSVHTRSDSWSGIGAVKEAIRIAELTGASLQLSHLVYQVGMGMMTEALEIINEAIENGLDVTGDSGMYHAFATFIGSAVYDEGCLEKWGCDYSNLYVATGKYAGNHCTQTIFEDLRANHKDDVVVAFVGREAEVYEALQPNYMMVSSDGGVGSPTPGNGHPQDVGTFPRFLQKMVRERNDFSLVEAVRKCSLLPAERLGLENKGKIKVGADADLVLLDLHKIADQANYPGLGQPDAAPMGIETVIVNGKVVVRQGELKGEILTGKPIRDEKKIWFW